METYSKFLCYRGFLLVTEIFALNNNIMELVDKLTSSVPLIYQILDQDGENKNKAPLILRLKQ